MISRLRAELKTNRLCFWLDKKYTRNKRTILQHLQHFQNIQSAFFNLIYYLYAKIDLYYKVWWLSKCVQILTKPLQRFEIVSIVLQLLWIPSNIFMGKCSNCNIFPPARSPYAHNPSTFLLRGAILTRWLISGRVQVLWDTHAAFKRIWFLSCLIACIYNWTKHDRIHMSDCKRMCDPKLNKCIRTQQMNEIL